VFHLSRLSFQTVLLGIGKHSDERKNGEDPPPDYEGGIPILPGPVEREKADRARAQIEDRKYKKEQRTLQWRMLYTQIAIVFLGLIGSGVSVWQVNIAQDSADRSALLIQKNERDARFAAEKQLAESKRQFDGTFGQMADQTTISRDAMEVEERAWMDISTGKGQLVDGQPITIPLQILNAGKTPAYGMRGLVVLNLLKKGETLNFVYRTRQRTHPVAIFNSGAIVPSSPNTIYFPVLPKYLPLDQPGSPIFCTPEIRKGIGDGSLSIIIYARVDYADMFGIPHWRKYCGVMHNDSPATSEYVLRGCGDYNGADKNTEKDKRNVEQVFQAQTDSR
jgi:hypothetical protein